MVKFLLSHFASELHMVPVELLRVMLESLISRFKRNRVGVEEEVKGTTVGESDGVFGAGNGEGDSGGGGGRTGAGGSERPQGDSRRSRAPPLAEEDDSEDEGNNFLCSRNELYSNELYSEDEDVVTPKVMPSPIFCRERLLPAEAKSNGATRREDFLIVEAEASANADATTAVSPAGADAGSSPREAPQGAGRGEAASPGPLSPLKRLLSRLNSSPDDECAVVTRRRLVMAHEVTLRRHGQRHTGVVIIYVSWAILVWFVFVCARSGPWCRRRTRPRRLRATVQRVRGLFQSSYDTI